MAGLIPTPKSESIAAIKPLRKGKDDDPAAGLIPAVSISRGEEGMEHPWGEAGSISPALPASSQPKSHQIKRIKPISASTCFPFHLSSLGYSHPASFPLPPESALLYGCISHIIPPGAVNKSTCPDG